MLTPCSGSCATPWTWSGWGRDRSTRASRRSCSGETEPSGSARPAPASSGLPVTVATLTAGKRLALANKESLIAAGPVVQPLRATPGAELISAPIDENGVKVDELEKLIVEHKPKFVYLIPTFGNPSGAMLSLERRKRVL